MGDAPDFRFEVTARAYAAVPLAIYAGVAALAIGTTAAIPALRQEQWWVNTLSVGVPALTLFLGMWYGPAAVRGGVYRAQIRDGQVRVDSPSQRVFGPGFEAELGRSSGWLSGTA